MHQNPLSPAPLWRRLAAAGYDFLLLLAIWFLLSGVLVMLYAWSGLPMEDLDGIRRPPQSFLRMFMLPCLLLATWLFYAYFWMRGGQTLGMRAWRIRVRDELGRPLRVSQTLLRMIAASLSWLTLGLGYLLVLFPPFQSFHDRVSQTETVVVPAERKKK